MECDVVDIYETEGFDNFICSIANTYTAQKCSVKMGNWIIPD